MNASEEEQNYILSYFQLFENCCHTKWSQKFNFPTFLGSSRQKLIKQFTFIISRVERIQNHNQELLLEGLSRLLLLKFNRRAVLEFCDAFEKISSFAVFSNGMMESALRWCHTSNSSSNISSCYFSLNWWNSTMRWDGRISISWWSVIGGIKVCLTLTNVLQFLLLLYNRRHAIISLNTNISC